MKKILAMVLLIIFILSGCTGEEYENYEEILGIDELIHSNQEPLKETEIDGYVYKHYEDICLVFRDSGAYVRAEISGDKYKLDEGITIGSEKKVVEQIFAKKEKIKDLPENQFGFIEEDIWVHFHYDESDIVEKISIYSVGP